MAMWLQDSTSIESRGMSGLYTEYYEPCLSETEANRAILHSSFALTDDKGLLVRTLPLRLAERGLLGVQYALAG